MWMVKWKLMEPNTAGYKKATQGQQILGMQNTVILSGNLLDGRFCGKMTQHCSLWQIRRWMLGNMMICPLLFGRILPSVLG